MNFEKFIEEILKRVQEELHECNASVIEINKNNGVILKGLKITKEESQVSPTIYLESYFDRYNKGEEIELLVEDIVNCYQYAEDKTPMNVEEYSDFENVKDRIAYKLINLEKNKELLEDIPYLVFFDLAVVFYYICENCKHSQATILVKNDHLKIWNKTKNNIFEIAVLNTPRLLKVSIRGMHSVIKQMIEKEEIKFLVEGNIELKNEREEMYVLTNQNGIFGAACILYNKVLESFSYEINKDFFILPSSIHEVILVPQNGGIETKKLRKMVQEVNQTEVLEEEILSNNVYFYSYSNQKFTIA